MLRKSEAVIDVSDLEARRAHVTSQAGISSTSPPAGFLGRPTARWIIVASLETTHDVIPIQIAIYKSESDNERRMQQIMGICKAKGV